MKTFDVRVGVDSLNLKVKFSCKISISLKYKTKQHSIVDEQPLINGNFTAPIKEIVNLQADYNQKEDKFTDNQSFTIILYLHSSHGKLLVGSFLYKLNEFKFKKSIVEKIKNSPDKNAEIKLTLEIVKNKNRKQAASSNDDDLIAKYTPKLRVTSMRNYSSQDIQINSPEPKKESQYQNLLKSLSGSSNYNFRSGNMSKIQEKPGSAKLMFKSTVNSPQISPRNNNFGQSTVARLASSKAQKVQNRNSVQILKKKLSEVKQNSLQGNQKYLQRIAELEKELKQSKEKVSSLQLDIKLKESNSKYFEKDLAAKKEKNESMEIEVKELSKKILNYEQKIRELEYNLKHLTQEHNEIVHSNEILSKKIEKREDYYRSLVENLNQKCYQIERDKENVHYKVTTLQNQLEENNKIFNNELKQKDKRYAEQKNSLTKKIALLEKILEQKKSQCVNLAQKIKGLHKQVQQLKGHNEKIVNQKEKLRNTIQQLTLSVSKQEVQKKALQQQLNEQKLISHQNKALKEELESKQEEIELNTKKIGKMEEEIAQNQQKIKQLTNNLQNLEEEYEKLYYENIGQNQQIERKKKLIADLTQQNQHMDKNLEKLNFTLKNQANQFQEQRAELQESLKILKIQNDKNTIAFKDTKNELSEQSERRRICEKQLLDAKKRIDDLENQVQNLQSRINYQTQEFNKIKGSNILLTSRNDNLSAQIQQMKKLKDQKQLKLIRVSQENQQIIHDNEEKIQALEESVERLNEEVAKLNKHNEQMNHVIDSKKDQINELRQQSVLKRNQQRLLNEAKIDLQRKNAQSQQMLIQLHEKIEKLQADIEQLHNQNKQLDELLKLQKDEQNETQKESSITSYELIKKKIKDLLNESIKREKQIEQYKANISNLELQIAHFKDEEVHLKEQIMIKNDEISQLNRSDEELKKYFDENLLGLKEQLGKKQSQILAVSIFKFQNDLRVDQHKNTIEKYKQLMQQLTNKVAITVEEKNKADQTITQNQKIKFQLNNEIAKYKANQIRLNDDQSQLKTIIKEMREEIQTLNEQIAQLNNKNSQLSQKNQQMDQKVKEYQEAIDQLKEKIRSNQKQIQSKQLEYEKQQHLIDNLSQQSAEKNKDLNKKLQALKFQLTQKSKQLAQVQTERKNRIQVLSNNLDQLKKQNFDLQSVAYAQKSNNTKLNSILSELTSSINKIEKANNIKTYYMIPIKDLLTKFEQIMNASDKMYAQFEKKNTKRQEKAATHGSKSSQDFIQI